MTVDAKVKTYLTDLVAHAEPFFRDPKERVFIEREEGKLVAVAFTLAGTLLFKAVAREQLSDIDTVACLGSLGYLRAVLDHPKIRDGGTMSIVVAKATNGQPAVRQFVFFGKRTEFTYQAHDPYATAVTRRKGTSTPATTVDFQITPEVVKEFEEIVRVHAVSDDDAKLFTVAYSDGHVKAIFGNRGTGAQLILASSVTGDNVKAPLSSLFEIIQFRQVMKMCAHRGALVKMMPLGIQFETDTEAAVYSYAMKIRKAPE